ncbi:MAG: hypothetical protein A2583_06260 [Bdellovibrionales bacterium RIFOXYD1_FULL_53_11]|nr:MAG: hypothetical protein A2583_06260 [Bdellovibrionales bacterium RIFOXYD1_FULL_53_11]
MNFEDIVKTLKAEFGETVKEAAPGTVVADPGEIEKIALFCRDNPLLDFKALIALSGVDHPGRIEIVLHLASYGKKHFLVIKTALDRNKPEISTLENVWKTANWHERECAELLGVLFKGHSDPRKLLLPDDWLGYPLRKDYVPPTEYHGISHSRHNPVEKKRGAPPS